MGAINAADNKDFYRIKPGLFLVLALVYFISSLCAFVLTSGGWTGFLLYVCCGSIFYLVNLLVLSGLILTKRPAEISIPKQWLIRLIMVQFIALLFNYGDCGDSGGSYNFFERLVGINGWNSCHHPLLGDGVAVGIALLLLVSYVACLILLYYKTVRQSFKSDTGNVSATINLCAMLLLSVAPIYLLLRLMVFITMYKHPIPHFKIQDLVLVTMYAVAGFGVLRRYNWARILAIIISCFPVVNTITKVMLYRGIGVHAKLHFRLNDTVLWVLSLAVVIFFTRESVKREFN